MLIKKFPVPCRVDYVPSPYEPDEDGVQDVGYYNGRLSDGRAYRLECWRMDDMLMLTVMFSDLCLDGYRREDMPLLLEAEEIVRFTGAGRKLQAARTEDDRGQDVWAINLLLANKKGTYAEIVPELTRYII
ncbi:hypothetical protein [uncultured Phascolarctobacterium sp.]|uniref:hypothetical protein n=1 Tax=uncultured Phascolarctobacterium sp. TaxID=512296 RepID=UPI002638E444|nr:hypothetical protein [uncultured Phascolarctobacterium sp.]